MERAAPTFAALAYDKDKLIAALQFVDYLYSEDGQIVSTFGPMAKNANGEGGFWYNEVQANPVETQNEDGTVSKNYFTYKEIDPSALTSHLDTGVSIGEKLKPSGIVSPFAS